MGIKLLFLSLTKFFQNQQRIPIPPTVYVQDYDQIYLVRFERPTNYIHYKGVLVKIDADSKRKDSRGAGFISGI